LYKSSGILNVSLQKRNTLELKTLFLKISLSCSACPVLPALFCLSCSACPVLLAPFCSPCSARPLLPVIFCPSCSANPILLVLFCLSSPACPAHYQEHQAALSMSNKGNSAQVLNK
jgi:hypothetical protein